MRIARITRMTVFVWHASRCVTSTVNCGGRYATPHTSVRCRDVLFLCNLRMCVTHLQHEDLAGGAVDVEFTVGRIVRIDALARQEVHNVLGSIFVPVGGGYLRGLRACVGVCVRRRQVREQINVNG